jgi:hypothetical protein
MNIKVSIKNALTGEVVVDHTINVDSTFEITKKNHEIMAHAYPDCHVNFVMDNGDFIYGIPVNMERDERELSFEDYCAKWYPNVNDVSWNDISGMSDEEIERQIDEMLESEWNERDSFSY